MSTGVANDDIAKRAEVARRRSEAIKLRLAGATYQQIADSDLYPDGAHRAQAYMDVKRALEEHRAEIHEDLELLRTEQLLQLARLRLAMWQRALGGDVRSAEICLKIIDKESDLLGTKAPVRHTLESESAIDRAIRDLEEEFLRREADRRRAAIEAGETPPAA